MPDTKDKTDLVDRLIEAGDDLSLEAAEKIIALRMRGKFWEKATKQANGKYMKALIRAMKAEGMA